MLCLCLTFPASASHRTKESGEEEATLASSSWSWQGKAFFASSGAKDGLNTTEAGVSEARPPGFRFHPPCHDASKRPFLEVASMMPQMARETQGRG